MLHSLWRRLFRRQRKQDEIKKGLQQFTITSIQFCNVLIIVSNHPSSSHCKQRCHDWSQPELSIQKSSIPKYQEWSIRYYFYMVFRWKGIKKKLDTQMSWMKLPMSFLHVFSMKLSKKKFDTQISQIKNPLSVLYGFLPWKRPKKLDTQIPWIIFILIFPWKR